MGRLLVYGLGERGKGLDVFGVLGISVILNSLAGVKGLREGRRMGCWYSTSDMVSSLFPSFLCL